MSTIRAISLDFDDTLWHAEPVLLKAESAMRQWLQVQAPEALACLEPDKVKAYKGRAILQQPRLAHQVSGLRIAVLQQAFAEAGHAEGDARQLANEAFQVFYDTRQQVTLFDSVPRVLESLAKCFTLISITNGNADPETIGIAKYFSFSLSAESVGIGKPAPEIFNSALARLALPASSVLHVGDHLLDDVFGASSVGMRTVWINRDNAVTTSVGNQTADVVIGSISELPEVVAKLG